MPITRRATGRRRAASPPRPRPPPKPMTTKTSTKVPMISVTRFQPYERIAGPVENTPSLFAATGSASKCCLYATQQNTAPMMAPMSCAAMYVSTEIDVHRHAHAELGGAVGDEAEGDGRVELRTRRIRDRDAGEDREPPSEVHHEEPAVVALRLRERDVRDDAAAEQHEHGGADEFREEHDSEIVHVDLPSLHGGRAARRARVVPVSAPHGVLRWCRGNGPEVTYRPRPTPGPFGCTCVQISRVGEGATDVGRSDPRSDRGCEVRRRTPCRSASSARVAATSCARRSTLQPRTRAAASASSSSSGAVSVPVNAMLCGAARGRAGARPLVAQEPCDLEAGVVGVVLERRVRPRSRRGTPRPACRSARGAVRRARVRPRRRATRATRVGRRRSPDTPCRRRSRVPRRSQAVAPESSSTSSERCSARAR